MKKLFLFIVVVTLTTTCAMAQEGIRYGIVAGMNVSKFTPSSFHTSKIGFHVGARAEIPLTQLLEGMYLDGSALLSLKGSTVKFTDWVDIKQTPYYLEIPVHAGYRYIINDNVSLFGSVGSYLAFGLFGKTKQQNLLNDGQNQASANFFRDGMKRFDFGVGIKAGVELSNKYRFSLGYDWGLIKVNNADGGSIGMTNRNFFISLAYMF